MAFMRSTAPFGGLGYSFKYSNAKNNVTVQDFTISPALFLRLHIGKVFRQQTFPFGKSIHYCSCVPLPVRARPVRSHHRFHCALAGLRISFHRLFRVNFCLHYSAVGALFAAFLLLSRGSFTCANICTYSRLFIICMERESMFAFDLNPPHRRQREGARDPNRSIPPFSAAAEKLPVQQTVPGCRQEEVNLL